MRVRGQGSLWDTAEYEGHPSEETEKSISKKTETAQRGEKYFKVVKKTDK